MTRQQYIDSYLTEKTLMDSHHYPYEAEDARTNVKMLNARASLLCAMIKKEKWNEETKDREINKMLTDVGLQIAKAEGGLI